MDTVHDLTLVVAGLEERADSHLSHLSNHQGSSSVKFIESWFHQLRMSSFYYYS